MARAFRKSYTYDGLGEILERQAKTRLKRCAPSRSLVSMINKRSDLFKELTYWTCSVTDRAESYTVDGGSLDLGAEG